MKMLTNLIILLLAILLVLATTYGWRFWSPVVKIKQPDHELVKRLKNHVYTLAHEIGDRSIFKYDQLIKAENYIKNQLKSFGYTVERQTYETNGRSVSNIIATKIGDSKPDEVIIIGAHYDTCYNPGADDNASAIAGLLELARSMRAVKTECTIKFIAFVNEEPPFFKTKNMGSYVYAKSAKDRGENIKAAIILEMIGYYSNKPFSQRYPPLFGPFYPNKANFISVVSNLKFKWLGKQVVKSFKQSSTFPIESISTFGFVPGIDFSDHWSFWKNDYPAVMITDTAYYRYKHYHRSTDTYEKLNYDYIAEVVKGLEGLIKSFRSS